MCIFVSLAFFSFFRLFCLSWKYSNALEMINEMAEIYWNRTRVFTFICRRVCVCGVNNHSTVHNNETRKAKKERRRRQRPIKHKMQWKQRQQQNLIIPRKKNIYTKHNTPSYVRSRVYTRYCVYGYGLSKWNAFFISETRQPFSHVSANSFHNFFKKKK